MTKHQAYINNMLNRINWENVVNKEASVMVSVMRNILMRWYGYCDGADVTKDERDIGGEQIIKQFESMWLYAK